MKIIRIYFFIYAFSCLFLSSYASATLHSAEQKNDNVTATASIPNEQIWVDRWQRQLTQTFNLQAQTIDGWFIDAPSTSSDAGASGKIRLGWEPRTRNLGEFDTRFKIKLSLLFIVVKIIFFFPF